MNGSFLSEGARLVGSTASGHGNGSFLSEGGHSWSGQRRAGMNGSFLSEGNGWSGQRRAGMNGSFRVWKSSGWGPRGSAGPLRLTAGGHERSSVLTRAPGGLGLGAHRLTGKTVAEQSLYATSARGTGLSRPMRDNLCKPVAGRAAPPARALNRAVRRRRRGQARHPPIGGSRGPLWRPRSPRGRR
jgi:hypothetical protein